MKSLGAECVFMQELIEELTSTVEEPIEVYCDNQSACKMEKISNEQSIAELVSTYKRLN